MHEIFFTQLDKVVQSTFLWKLVEHNDSKW
jgi:hypothetical protein